MTFSKTQNALAKTFLFFAMIIVLLDGRGAALSAAERHPPLPSEAPLPVVGDKAEAEALMEQARLAGKAFVVDLTLGHEGVVIKAQSAKPLTPGRYRLHALVASTPHDHILVEAVALNLKAGESAVNFERRDSFPQPGELTPLHMDFVVSTTGPVEIGIKWLVGDTKLDMMQYRIKDKARQVYLAQRQNAINQYELQEQTKNDTGMDSDVSWDALDLEAELGEKKPRHQQQALANKNQPSYRLLLAGLVIEPLTPVDVLVLGTDKPAYSPSDRVQASAELHNLATIPVRVNLEWNLEDDDKPGDALVTAVETIELQAGQKLSHSLEKPFPTKDISLIGRLQLNVSVAGLRENRREIPFVMLPPPRNPYPQDKRIFAHYMGCWPIGYGPLPGGRINEGKELKHESGNDGIRRGGHVRNYTLAPPDLSLTPEESADLEIRRALRIGIDGFSIDAWAGGELAKKVFITLLKTAAAKKYPFEVTICIDPSCGGNIAETVKWLVDNYGDHPNLARRDGKPLVFGYYSQGPAWGYADRKLGANTEDEKRAVRTSPLGWHLAGAAFRQAERQVGRSIFFHFDYGYIFHPFTGISAEMEVTALGTIARHIGAVGAFQFQGSLGDEKAKAVKASGAEWSGACGFYQKENIPLEYYIQPGTEFLEWKWGDIRRQDATLPQFTTWNDYGESTHIAPAWETRYTLYDLTGYHIAWWKTGKPPVVDHDRVYLIYAKYPRGAKVWPFAEGARKPRMLEVLTILPEPATIRLPGRDIEFEAPAGYARQQFPLTVGPVIAEVIRGGKVVTRIESPEPITDRPFRESNGMVCYSTEFKRHWQADFGDAKPFLYGEYADDDHDGLPNWFEMYWFSEERGFESGTPGDEMELEPEVRPVTRWLDFSTMTLVDPKADPDGDGKSNLEEYRSQSDPTVNMTPRPGGKR
ncbi:MAG: hypothetical protein HQL31_01605 [Planctomycetes bacterium]|nr:hypothetical protein [Planctomycetota bacterium]